MVHGRTVIVKWQPLQIVYRSHTQTDQAHWREKTKIQTQRSWALPSLSRKKSGNERLRKQTNKKMSKNEGTQAEKTYITHVI